MEIEFMREYVALATNLNFTATASQRYIMQSTLSRHLAKIEAELGTQLLIRTTHNVLLTEKGKRVLEEFKKILALYDALLEGISSRYRSSLCIDVPYYAMDRYVTPVLRRFKTLYPEVQIDLRTHKPMEVLESLCAGEADLGLLMRPVGAAAPCPSGTELPLTFYPFCRESLACMMQSGHPLARKGVLKLEHLQDTTVVLMKDHAWLNEFVERLLERRGVTIGERRLTDHVDTLTMTVQESDGVAVVPGHLSDMRHANMVVVPLQGQELELCLAHRTDNRNPNIMPYIHEARLCFGAD